MRDCHLPRQRFSMAWMLSMLLVFLSCQPQPTTPDQGQQPDSGESARLASLQRQRDSLTTKFTLKAQNLALPSYYHSTWGAYALSREGLLAGVDSNGVVFLIHCYDCTIPASKARDPQHVDVSRELRCGDHPADLQLDLNGRSYLLPSNPQIEAITWGLDGAIHRDPCLTDTLYCTDYFILSDTSSVMQMLAERDLQLLHYSRLCDGQALSEPGSLRPADQAALRDCAQLGRVLQEMHRQPATAR